jgi:hypothetical protein
LGSSQREAEEILIIVTGIPRSGTSAIMQTLKLLGVPVAGAKFPARELPVLNPRGFYELDTVTMYHGIHDYRYKGQAVKLLGLGLNRTDKTLISKVILSERSPLDCQESMLKSLWYFLPEASIGMAVSAYDIFEESVNHFLKANGKPLLRVRLENLKKDPKTEVKRIADFIGVEVNTQAIDNIIRS